MFKCRLVMRENGRSMLQNFWYLALPGHCVKTGQMLPKTLFGQPLLLARQKDGTPFAFQNICPHRGIPLHYGTFDGCEVTCCYHGWKFAPDGHCTEIPSLFSEQDLEVSRIKVRTYPCREVQGNIWVFFGGKHRAGQVDIPDVPWMDDVEDSRPIFEIRQHFPCDSDHAAFGLMDPTHAAFVHTSWWWKKRARKLREKEKDFEPVPLGWRMKRHPLPPQNRIYKLFGSDVTTEITYQLPGLRIEHIKGNRHFAVGLTAITPITPTETEIHYCLYSSISWLVLVRPLLCYLANIFLGQDRDVVIKQQEGLRHDPALMLIDDADTQAKWYRRLKREWIQSLEEGRSFVNPLKGKTLRWRS